MAVTTETLAERVRAARGDAGFTVRSLAERVPGLDHTAISRIETGKRRVASHELFELAEALGVTTSHLLGETRRRGALTVAARLGAEAAPDYLKSAVDRVTQIIEMDDLLDRVTGPATGDPSLTVDSPRGGSATSQGKALALAAREELGLGVAPVSDIFGLMEERVGAHVVAQPIDGEVHGLCVSDGDVAVVLINSADRWARQRFTAAHELGHLLYGDLELYEVTWKGERDAVPEKRADSFAAHFLAPDDAIRNFVGERTVDTVVVGELMSYFGLSFEAMCWRLMNSRCIGKNTFDRLTSQGIRSVVAAADLADEFAARSRAAENVTRPPARLVRRAVDAYERGDVGVGVVATVLGSNDLGAVRRFLTDHGVLPPAQSEALPVADLV